MKVRSLCTGKGKLCTWLSSLTGATGLRPVWYTLAAIAGLQNVSEISKCHSDKGDSLGLLHFVGQDPLDPAAWKKLPGPAFTKGNGEYSTGHNGSVVVRGLRIGY